MPGKVFAIRDICPHRAIPLSHGWYNGEDVQCCYHGWRFNEHGKCVDIPSLMPEQEMDLSRFDVQRYDVQEVQGNIWIYMPDPDRNRARPPQFDIPRVPGFQTTPHPT
jgi:phenylpropionate dioxygenase-like ring-hydroxylating dioxygenase large terminal subunit